MGFIEKEEQKSRERNKKLQEDRERERRVYQENQDRLALQKTLVMEEKKRLYRLQREAKAQFAASGLETMLSRLIKARAIESALSDSVVREEVGPQLPERAWEEMKIKDGSLHTRVVVSDESIDIRGSSKYVKTERFFNIITDSTGLIIFEYGYVLPRHKEVQWSEWRKDSRLLEDLLEKAFNSPRTIKTKGEHPPYQSPGR